eukprot:TRINITY_DN5245_c0_g1_i7.p1 TRINITY_DN5245_c0_g1~~TRINITY_DN5245_c0_g1_i7.p1  ORF type:complete len:363 (-),score=33.73 TRINITY_DN5245_c0_g1_i7:98-1186(-)
MQITDLPDELLCQIIAETGSRDSVQACAQVCSRWYTFSNDLPLWQGFFEQSCAEYECAGITDAELRPTTSVPNCKFNIGLVKRLYTERVLWGEYNLEQRPRYKFRVFEPVIRPSHRRWWNSWRAIACLFFAPAWFMFYLRGSTKLPLLTQMSQLYVTLTALPLVLLCWCNYKLLIPHLWSDGSLFGQSTNAWPFGLVICVVGAGCLPLMLMGVQTVEAKRRLSSSQRPIVLIGFGALILLSLVFLSTGSVVHTLVKITGAIIPISIAMKLKVLSGKLLGKFTFPVMATLLTAGCGLMFGFAFYAQVMIVVALTLGSLLLWGVGIFDRVNSNRAPPRLLYLSIPAYIGLCVGVVLIAKQTVAG